MNANRGSMNRMPPPLFIEPRSKRPRPTMTAVRSSPYMLDQFERRQVISIHVPSRLKIQRIEEA